jgi:hypothetical protein
MAVHIGTKLMGKVDEVPRLGYVATQFFHVNYLPLIPTGTYFVLGEAGDEFQGVAIPFSPKSILMAWLRAALFLAFILAVVFTIIAVADKKTPAAIGLGVGGGLVIAAFCATYYIPFISRAGYHRAIELGRRVGATDEFLLMLEVEYGRKTAAEADLELERIEEQRAVASLTTPE